MEAQLRYLPSGSQFMLRLGVSSTAIFACVALQLGASAVDAAAEDAPVRADTVTFENANPGPFDKLDTQIGTWTTQAGRAIVDDRHAKTGNHCLQLPGGKQTVVTLKVADGIDTSGTLTFWAERWTARKPFSFRIEKHAAGGWTEIYNGDAKVRVGRAFLNHVQVPLADPGIQRLRFTCTSPADTGILIDDIRVAPARPQEITNVEVVPFTLPALVGAKACRLAKLKIETTGSLDPIALTKLQAKIIGAANFESLQLGRDQRGASVPLAMPAAPDEPANWKLPPIRLAEGTNILWITCKLKPTANIDLHVGAAIEQVSFSNGQTIELDAPPSMQRLGVAVRQGGDDGVHTYRIPGLATTNDGTLIGVYDVRRRSGGDLPGDIDVGMSRSTDRGRTWEPMKVIMDMGDDPRWRYDGIGDPAVLVDRGTGTIWVAATWSHGDRSWRGSGPGLAPEQTGQWMLVRSDDDGVTWSKPINITSQVKRPEWCFILQGPGKGITMHDGTIVFAAQYQDPPEQNRLPHSTIIYSRDHGDTWQVGSGAFDDTTEAQVVETEPGVLMLNCRYNRKSVRVVMTTRDMGKTWQKHATSERSLIEPRACMASLIDTRSYPRQRVDVAASDFDATNDPSAERGVDGWLLFSNPDSKERRNHLTIKASPDRGLTWPRQHRLLFDEGKSAGYSCMTMIDKKTVGILYEGSQAQMTFQRIPLDDLIRNESAETREKRTEKTTALKLPRVFGDHMVLQADTEIPVWGSASAGASVTVTLGNDRQTARADDAGQWIVRLGKQPPSSTPTTIVVESGHQRIVIQKVLVGEVWVCAGQSNMQWMLSQSDGGKQELATADHPHLRLLHLKGGAGGNSGSYTSEHLARLTPATFCEGQWEVASAESAADFSAVAWYFGRRLQRELNVPVGLVCPAVGGTPAEAWMPRESIEAVPELKGLAAGNWLDNRRLGEFCRTRGEQNLLAAMQAGVTIPGDEFGPNHPFKPGFMWDAGIEPLIPYAIRGVIWYQGESNAETRRRVREHGRLFPLLIRKWREHWGRGDFPFLYVQLPALNRPEWPWFRESQRRMMDELDNVGMAITIDTGHPTNVHPTLKEPLGERLARWALGTTYKSKAHATYSGPLLEVAEREGDSLVVSFKHVGGGLKSSDTMPLRHFEVCGADGAFHPATAKIIGRHTIAVSSPRVAEPHHVRYAWVPFPDPPINLINSARLPASPFSTHPNPFAGGHEGPGL